MVIGTQFFGKVRKVNGQAIATKFVIIGVPLFPVTTMFVVKDMGNTKQGYEIDLNGESVGLGYGRMITFILGLILTLIGSIGIHEERLLVPGMICIGLWGVFQFVLGQPRKEEEAKRLLIGNILGVNAFPEWLPQHVSNALYRQLQALYEQRKDKYGGMTWEQCIKGRRAIQPDYALFFTLAVYRNYFMPGMESEKLLEDVWSMRQTVS
ncbi:MAG TPA: hypothetical protein VFU15_14665 [Bacteroidia bacterium]|nr:hypothetical protein [Bacteroidia bacterium]